MNCKPILDKFQRCIEFFGSFFCEKLFFFETLFFSSKIQTQADLREAETELDQVRQLLQETELQRESLIQQIDATTVELSEVRFHFPVFKLLFFLKLISPIFFQTRKKQMKEFTELQHRLADTHSNCAKEMRSLESVAAAKEDEQQRLEALRLNVGEKEQRLRELGLEVFFFIFSFLIFQFVFISFFLKTLLHRLKMLKLILQNGRPQFLHFNENFLIWKRRLSR